MTILLAGDLTSAELQALLAGLETPAGETARCWLDAPDGWALDYWQGWTASVQWNHASQAPSKRPVPDLFPRLACGRIFAPSGELKWRVLPVLGQSCCRTVFLGNAPWNHGLLERLAQRPEIAALVRHEVIYPLWGQQTAETPDEWVDLRIPLRLRYPVEVPQTAQGRIIAKIRAEIWSDASGQPQFLRLCDLMAHWEP